MRLLHTFTDDRDARTFSSYLTQQGIENQLDIKKNTDWGTHEYGNVTCNVWVIDEDDLEKAHELLSIFLDNPQDKKFTYLRPIAASPDIIEMQQDMTAKEPLPQFVKKPSNKAKSLGVVTFYLILGCTMLFFLSLAITRPVGPPPSGIALTPLYSSPIKKALLYDYPESYVIIDKVVDAYGFDKLSKPKTLPAEGQYLLEQYYKTPTWQGFYDKIIAYFHSGTPITVTEPLFEKIRQGELWRLLTPVLLHNDLFHIFFNMIWLLVLGKQMEKRLGIPRYLLFMVVTGIFSNTMQYLMSGPNFIGFSGILCAMIMFVWIRQKNTPWEGYQLLPATMKFIVIFVLALASIQGASFVLEIQGMPSIAPGIANTAHLTGALAGYFLAKLKYFAWKSKQ